MTDRTIHLSDAPVRRLTDRECAIVLGGTISALIQMAEPDDIRRALEFWACNRTSLYPAEKEIAELSEFLHWKEQRGNHDEG